MGGPLNGKFIPAPASPDTRLLMAGGKYVYSPEHYRSGECWLWHKFIP